jgi:squamous cell carcinoma antigen recognized by T-cells 3
LLKFQLCAHRNGHSKGLAYVDFEDDAAAAQAVLKTDKLELDGKVICVAISRPPEKNKTSLIDIPSLGGRPRDPSAPRPQRGVLMPRAVRLALPSAETSQTNGASSSAAKKSNDEFRAMFLGNK